MFNVVGCDVLVLVEYIVMLYDCLGDQVGGNEQCGLVCIGVIVLVQMLFLVDVLVQFCGEFLYCCVCIVLGVLFDLFGLVDVGEIDFVVLIWFLFVVLVDLEWCMLVVELFVLLVLVSVFGDDWCVLFMCELFICYDCCLFGGCCVDQFLCDQCIIMYDVIEFDEL